MKDRVAIENDVDGPPDELREPAIRRPGGGAAPFTAVNVVNQVVFDQDSPRRRLGELSSGPAMSKPPPE